MGYALLKEFVERNARRVRDRWRATRLVNWLSEQEAILWMSIIKPTASAQQGELPNLHSFRGLRALTEVKNEKDEIEWHFLWGTKDAAEQHESGVASSFGSTSAMRAAVRSVTIPKEKWWEWFTLGKAAIALASLVY